MWFLLYSNICAYHPLLFIHTQTFKKIPGYSYQDTNNGYPLLVWFYVVLFFPIALYTLIFLPCLFICESKMSGWKKTGCFPNIIFASIDEYKWLCVFINQSAKQNHLGIIFWNEPTSQSQESLKGKHRMWQINRRKIRSCFSPAWLLASSPEAQMRLPGDGVPAGLCEILQGWGGGRAGLDGAGGALGGALQPLAARVFLQLKYPPSSRPP